MLNWITWEDGKGAAVHSQKELRRLLWPKLDQLAKDWAETSGHGKIARGHGAESGQQRVKRSGAPWPEWADVDL